MEVEAVIKEENTLETGRELGRDETSQMNPELWPCEKCGREFVDEESLKLHKDLHSVGDKHFTEAEIILRRELLYKEVRKQQDSDGDRQIVTNKVNYKPRRIYKPLSKRVGLTKIRLEDCLRCDACSCIYIDEQDYYKHMRNFHQKYNTVIPRSRRKSPLHHKCNISCTEVHPQEQPSQEKILPESPAPLLLTDSFIKEKIKNRWNKVSQRLSSQIKIKQEPADDMDYLLSQVEVKIKTEPPDYNEI